MKECIICNKMFINTHRLQKCCPGECLKLYRKNYKKKYMKSYMQEYSLRNKYKIYRKKYRSSEKFKLEEKQRQRIYSKTPQRKRYLRIWNHTLKGKLIILKAHIKRKEIRNNCIHDWTKIQWKNKKEQTHGICPGFEILPHYVGLDFLELDHFYPISKANEDFKRTGIKRVYTIDDIQPLCRSCNSRKQDKII